jgi:hypothetical protein
MSGPLKNPRHERFVQGLVEGKSALDAYEDAGYVADDGNSARLRANAKVQERLAELQAEIAAETTVTVQGLINELESARRAATDLKQLSAAIKAIEGKAKLSGLLVEKKQVEVTDSVNWEKLTTLEEIGLAAADNYTEYRIAPYHDYREEDRQRLAKMCIESMLSLYDAAAEYIEEICARPLKTSYKPPKALPSPYTNSKSRS